MPGSLGYSLFTQPSCIIGAVGKFLDLRSNLTALRGFLFLCGFGVLAGAAIYHYPRLLFAFPVPNGKLASLFFEPTRSVRQGVPVGLVGHVTVPATRSLLLGPHLQQSRWVPSFLKQFLGDRLAAFDYRYYERPLAGLSLVARGLSGVKVVGVDEQANGFRIRFLCETPGSSLIETSVRNGIDVRYADTVTVKCAAFDKVDVALGPAERRLVGAAPRPVKVGEEFEARFFIPGRGARGETYLSGDEGVKAGRNCLEIVDTGVAEVTCPGPGEQRCHVPRVRFRATASCSPTVLIGERSVSLPIVIPAILKAAGESK